MIQTTWQGNTAWLLNHQPDWADGVALRARVPAVTRRGLTGREARRPLANALQCGLDYSATLEREAVNALRNALQAASTEPILCPAWPFALPGADWADPPVAGGLIIGWLEDWSDFEIGESLADPAAWDWVAPCLVGRLEQTPQPEALGPETARVRFSFAEDAEALYALQPAAQTWTNGPALGDSTTPAVFPWDASWESPPAGGAAEIVRDDHRLGPARQSATLAWPQSPERLVSADILLTSREDIAALLRWWADRLGQAEPHYVPEALAITSLASDAPQGATTIQLASGATIGDNRILALSDPAGLEIVRITNLVGNTATLASGVLRPWAASTTLVRLAILARHASDELHLDLVSPELAACRLAWREVPAEYTPASGETRAETLGPLPTMAWLYAVTVDRAGATETHRWTSFERAITAAGQSWPSRPCEHGELRQSLALDRDELTLKVRWWDGCPFEQFLPNSLEARLTLDIWEATVSGDTATDLVQWFSGVLTGCQFEGPMLTLSAAGANALFDLPVPRLLLQPGCNHCLFDASCGLDLGDWEIAAKVQALSEASLTIEDCSRSGGLPDGFGTAHWFALGLIQWTASGVIRRAHILDSTAQDGSRRITLSLARAPANPPTVGQSVTLWPGCDGRPETCRAYDANDNPQGRFNNYARFGGFPLIPATNPGFTPLKTSSSVSGKK